MAIETHISADFSLEGRIEAVLEGFRPYLLADGGDVKFLGIERGLVRVKLQGSCVGCPSSLVTLRQGIEQVLLREVPEVMGVEAVGL